MTVQPPPLSDRQGTKDERLIIGSDQARPGAGKWGFATSLGTEIAGTL
jgi:hypothetical protein